MLMQEKVKKLENQIRMPQCKLPRVTKNVVSAKTKNLTQSYTNTRTKNIFHAVRSAGEKPKHFIGQAIGYLLNDVTQLNGKLATHCSHSLLYGV